MPFSTERAVGRRCDPSFLLALLSELVPSIYASALSHFVLLLPMLLESPHIVGIESYQHERCRCALQTTCASKFKL